MKCKYVKFEVLTAVTLKFTVIWYVIPHCLVEMPVYQTTPHHAAEDSSLEVERCLCIVCTLI
jgi:hypothetical protein